MRLLVVWLAFAADLCAGVFGVVKATNGQPLPGAEVQIQSESTGARWKTTADENGRYEVLGLPFGTYKVTTRMDGFRTVSRVGVPVDGTTSVDFVLELIELRQMVTVVADPDDLDPNGGSDGLLMTRQAPGAALPENGRDFRASFDLVPGVVKTPAGASDAGQFSANGARPNSHAFRVDGVSANTGVGSSTLPGSFPGASLPGMTAIGSTENLVTPESTESVELRTSNFAPEHGERPGAGAFIVTRSGSNDYHGEFFGQLRDKRLQAGNWFTNSRDIPYVRPKHWRAGGAFGGPILKDRTFFFVSAEKSQTIDWSVRLVSLPSVETRQNASERARIILDRIPVPSGPEIGDGVAEGLEAWKARSNMNHLNFRVDHTLGPNGVLFARYVRAPSMTSGYSALLSTNYGTFHWRSGTLGLTMAGPTGTTHDLRLNYSGSASDTLRSAPTWGWMAAGFTGMLGDFEFRTGPDEVISVPDTLYESLSPLLPGTGGESTAVGLSISGFGHAASGDYGRVRQDQWELRETISRLSGNHSIRAGADFIYLQPSRELPLRAIQGTASSLQELLDGTPLPMTYTYLRPFAGSISVVSLFGQDTFRVSENLNLVYGLRWELTPPTSEPLSIPTVSGIWTGTDWETTFAGDINGTAPWPMRYNQFAPRIGVAYRLPRSNLVLRAGAGIFFDARLGAAVNPVSGAPFNSWQISANQSGLGTGAGSSGIPSRSDTDPDVAQFLAGSYPELRLPESAQWRVALEKQLGSRGVASAAYVGGSGQNLLGNQTYFEPDTDVLRRLVTLTENSSSYHGLQLQYRGSLAPNLFGSMSYTWSHSIDDGSQDSSVFLIHPGYSLSDARGSSSFDVRHAFSAALSYRIGGWTLSGIVRARSGFPIDVRSSEQAFGLGFDNVGRPDLVPGVPLWISDASTAGGKRLNPAAFAAPAQGERGSLGRNAITGFGLFQVDTSLRREFTITRTKSLEFKLEAFNVFNSPSFSDPVPYLSSPWFGQSISMQNLMLGSGNPNGGLTPLFQPGGPRSVEVGVRFSF